MISSVWKPRLTQVVCLMLFVLLSVSDTDAQRGGGGGGGGGRNLPPGLQGERSRPQRERAEAMRMFPVAQIWAELSLNLELGDEKLDRLKPILVEAYAQRAALLKEAREEDAWAFAKGQLQKAEKDLWSKLSKELSSRERRQVDRATRQQ